MMDLYGPSIFGSSDSFRFQSSRVISFSSRWAPHCCSKRWMVMSCWRPWELWWMPPPFPIRNGNPWCPSFLGLKTDNGPCFFFLFFPNVKSTRNWENHWNWGIYLCQFSNFLTSPPAATPKVEAQNYISPKSQNIENIVPTLEDMKMKAREELNTMAVAEKQSLHSFMNVEAIFGDANLSGSEGNGPSEIVEGPQPNKRRRWRRLGRNTKGVQRSKLGPCTGDLSANMAIISSAIYVLYAQHIDIPMISNIFQFDMFHFSQGTPSISHDFWVLS